MRRKCEEILLQLGITPNLLGYTYIADAVEIIGKEDEKVKTTALYEIIAERHETTYHKVERPIRHAISKVDVDCEAFKECFNNANMKNKKNGHITNTVFLYTLAYRLKEE